VTDLQPIIEGGKFRKQTISLLSLLIKSFSLALTAHPKINSIYRLNSQFDYNLAA
jgi:hypothetical protein